MTMDLHTLPLPHAMLARQLRRLGIDPLACPLSTERWSALLALIGTTYEEYEQLVYLVTRAERMSTDELQRSQSALAEAERIAGLGSWIPGGPKTRRCSSRQRWPV